MAALAARWIRPVATAAVVELITVGGTVLAPSHTGRRPDAVGATLVVLAAAMVALARRWPVPALAVSLGATAAYYGLGYATDSSFFIGLLVTAYLSGTAEARLRVAAFAVAIPALFAAASLLGPGDRAGGLPISIIVLGGLLAGQASAEWRARADRRTAKVHEEEARRRLAEERLRIARELHDVVSHSIAMISVQASSAVHVMDDRPEQAREALLAIKAASRDALRDLRGILGVLHQAEDDEPRGPAAGLAEVGALVENVRRAGHEVTLDVDGTGDGLPAAIDLAAYRVIQEALTNVVRHAPGAAAAVAVRRLPDALEIEVRDEGRTVTAGAEGRQGAGRGLAGMRERVRAAGGSLEAGPRPAGGFAVRATLPL
jgi:signal transduction histidine kinase